MVAAADVAAVLLNDEHGTDRKPAAMERRSRRVLQRVMVHMIGSVECR